MKTVFADAGYWFALINPHDGLRPKVMAVSQRLGRCRIVTTEMVLTEVMNYDLKAVNPNRKNTEDTRTPDELLAVIEAKGREVAEVLAELRK